VAQLLYSHGDVAQPLQETVRVLDEIVTEFIQGVSFEATRTAHHAGRQKVKFEDFEFAMRKNPFYMGKVREIFEKKKEIDKMRQINMGDEDFLKEANKAEKKAAKLAAKEAKARGLALPGGGGSAKDEEELGEDDDDAEAEADALGTGKRRGH
jgi:transcription initiation factor TFIID subunit 13